METLKKRKWTVFFLIKAVDSDTTEYLIAMLKELVNIKFTEEVVVILCINFDERYQEAVRMLDLRLFNSTVKDPKLTTIFFKVPENGDRNELILLEKEDDFDITEEEYLRNFFKEKILIPYNAMRYLLFTWDHGNGFGIFSGPGQGSADEREVDIITSNVEKPVLTMDELSQAIQWSMDSRKIDLIIMMNCNMQVFDTGYALRNQAKYLVAPESAMRFSDYDYSAIFLNLAKNPEISAKKMSAWVIKSFKKNEPTRSSLYKVSIAACNLRYFDRLAIALNGLAVLMKKRLPNDFCTFRKEFKDSKVSGPNLIDLYSLLANLQKTGGAEEQLLITYIFSLQKKIIYKKFMGGAFAPPDENGYKTHHGISVLTPVSKSAPESVTKHMKDFLSNTSFQKTLWGELISFLIYLESQNPCEEF